MDKTIVRGDHMAQKSRRAGTEIGAGEAVRRILAAGSACSRVYRLPAEGGPQLTMTGEEEALGNLSVLPVPALKEALSSLPAMKKAGEQELEAYARRRRFFLLTGERDRLVALAASVEALIRAGYARILLLADTPSERDGLADFLRLTVPALGGAAGVYLPQDAGAREVGRWFAAGFGFLTSPG
ncbi:MAG: hypothetical protein IKX85_01230, partial [Clostridia bacterium]|nr:hypothetical protein [Clostridia bacterium]